MRARAFLGFVALLAVCSLTACGQAENAPPVPVPAPMSVKDVEYGVVGDISLRLDVYTPPGAGPFPAVIWLHGGGWEGGDKSSFNSAVSAYRAQRIAGFSVNYRFSSQAPYPAAVEDCLAAVRWVRLHAAEYRVDPDQLAVMGGSAGGHLAMMVATTRPREGELDSRGQPLKRLVQLAVSVAGPMDLAAITRPASDDPQAVTHAAYALRVLTQFLGGTPEQVPEKYAEASPINRVTADTAPTLLVYGLQDLVVPPAQAESMEKRLKDAGVAVETLPVEGRGHELAGIPGWPAVVEGLAGKLKGKPAA